jgi:hypothetical protein
VAQRWHRSLDEKVTAVHVADGGSVVVAGTKRGSVLLFRTGDGQSCGHVRTGGARIACLLSGEAAGEILAVQADGTVMRLKL